MKVNRKIDFNLKFTGAYRKASFAAACLIVLLILAVTVSSCVSHIGLARRVFYFPLAGKEKNVREVRYISENDDSGIKSYVEELMLGPMVNRARPLFSLGTELEFCFVRSGTAYIGLSKEALYEESNAAEIKKGLVMLKKNVSSNFNIKKFNLFIDGIFIE